MSLAQQLAPVPTNGSSSTLKDEVIRLKKQVKDLVEKVEDLQKWKDSLTEQQSSQGGYKTVNLGNIVSSKDKTVDIGAIMAQNKNMFN